MKHTMKQNPANHPTEKRWYVHPDFDDKGDAVIRLVEVEVVTTDKLTRVVSHMNPADIVYIRETFHLSQRDLAKALNVTPYTVARWEDGTNGPAGLPAEVLRALHNTAVHVQTEGDNARAAMIGGLIALGIGALIFYLLRATPGLINTQWRNGQRTPLSNTPLEALDRFRAELEANIKSYKSKIADAEQRIALVLSVRSHHV